MKLVNQTRHPVVFEDGTILAAAGTDGSTKEVASISEADRVRCVESGLVAVLVEQPSQTADELRGQQPATSSAPSASGDAPKPTVPEDATARDIPRAATTRGVRDGGTR